MLKRLVGTASAVVAVLAGGVLAAPAANAWAYDCQWTYFANGGGNSCSAPAGNQFRVKVQCRSQWNGRLVYAYGPWRNANGTTWSKASCASGDVATGLLENEGRAA